MLIQNISAKVVSTLGNPNSLVPLMVKDGVDSASLTYNSYKAGGKVEGYDRALDEFGTQAIWIGGIPFFKKLIDKTIYKKAKINPSVDPRIITDKEYSQWALKNAKGNMSSAENKLKSIVNKLFNNKNNVSTPGETVKDALKKCIDSPQKTKKLYMAKVAAATVLTLISYFSLTKYKQKLTKNRVEKEYESKKAANEIANKNVAKVFADISTFTDSQNQKSPSFKGVGKSLVEGIMFNPVHNMKLIDAGITTERLAQSRNKTELAEHGIKEGIFLFFMYGLGNVLTSELNKFSQKVFKKPIDLDIQVLMSEELKKGLKNSTIEKDLKALPFDLETGSKQTQKAIKNNLNLTKVLDFVVNNPNNVVVQSAKKCGIVSTIKDGTKEVVDTSKFIEKGQIYDLAQNLKNINNSFKKSNQPLKNFLNKTKGLKVASVVANLVACCFVLGYVVPKLIFKYREDKTGTTNFHVTNDIIKEEEAKEAGTKKA